MMMNGPRRIDPYENHSTTTIFSGGLKSRNLDAYKYVGTSTSGHTESHVAHGHCNPNVAAVEHPHQHHGAVVVQHSSHQQHGVSVRYSGPRSLAGGYGGGGGGYGHSSSSSSNHHHHHHPLHPLTAAQPLSPIDTTTTHNNNNTDKGIIAAAGAACDPLSPPPRGITSTVLRTLQREGQRFADSIAGRRRRPSKDNNSASLTLNVMNLLLIVLPVMILCWYGAPTAIDHATRPSKWKWSPGRRLDDRRCVMNLFVERQPPDEFNPDVEDIKPGAKNKDGTPKLPKPPTIVEGTYRTKGQMHVISRFIEAVADSFRSNTKVQQHVIFAGARDSGHLAEQALKHWPPRGSYRTQVHVIADDNDSSLQQQDVLDYTHLDAIEQRFKGKSNIHIYDRQGFAGVQGDDDEAPSLDLPDDEEEDLITQQQYQQQPWRSTSYNNSTQNKLPYPDFTKMIYPDYLDEQEDDSDNTNNILVPYLHIDGTSYSSQIEILNTAKPLLQQNKIVVVGMEHSPDLNVHDLVQRFRDVHYKTFFLGSRQITRVDHLCSEILDDVLAHPAVQPPPLHPLRKLAVKWGWVEKPKDDLYRIDEHGNYRPTPPFFVAMPKGRRMKEEMTIQHMYDLFGGYGGGGGQVKTANDRKAPGKK